MRTRTFAWFVAPSLAMMLLFIALPLVLAFVQSFYVTRNVFERVTIQSCTPGFLGQTCVEETRTRPKLDAGGKPVTETVFVGLESYRALLRPDLVAKAWREGRLAAAFADIDFYKALRFTLTFTIVTLPLVLGLGLITALAMDNVARRWRGPLIFTALLPYIITPVIGALAIKWLFIGDGILTALLRRLTNSDIAMFAQGWTIELLMLGYRVWHVAPFSFVVFYAGLQTVDRDTLESAIVDGASRFERLRLVVIPHLAPLIVFVALIHLMDSYRVFEEVIGFSSQAHRISLQWLTFHFLMPDETGNRAISRASASSMLTMIGIVLLLVPLLRKSWRDHRVKR
jgi:multiple sugar transport system permease protein